jgi:hypothetical protein
MDVGQHLNQQGLTQLIDLAFQMNPSGKRKFSYEDLIRFMGQEFKGKPQPASNRQPDLEGRVLEP